MSDCIYATKWRRVSESEYEYRDYDCSMLVVIELADARNDEWTVVAYSETLYDKESCYDVLSDVPYCGPYPSRIRGSQLFEEDGGYVKDIELPDWLVEHMWFCEQKDDEADDDFGEWAESLEENRFESYEEMEDSAFGWCLENFNDDPMERSDMMLRMGELMDRIIRDEDGYIVNP